MEKQIVQIARRIKELRSIVGLTPEDLATMTGVTTEEYLRIEAGETDFSFGFVHLCAKALRVDITNLISGDDANLSTVSVVRAGEGTMLDRPGEGATYRQLASKIKNRLAEPLYVCAKYDPAAQGKAIPLNSHAGEEFDYIISGALKVQVGNHINVLYPGDTIYYNSSEPHGMIAVGGTDCHFIATVIDAGGNAKKYATSSLPVVDMTGTSVEKEYNAFIRATETPDGRLLHMEYRNTERFNFTYDVVDKLAQANPEKLALLHMDRDKTVRRFTFDDIRKLSCKAANYFASKGIKKGDRVMLVLKRHWQFWVIMNAMHRLGAIVILAPNQLLKKDFIYRFDRAGITAVISTPDDGVPAQIAMACEECPNVRTLISVNEPVEGWQFFDAEYESFSEDFPRTEQTPCGTDPMLMFFTSGTTGYPKIAMHDFTYPLGHFVTAHYWHRVKEDGLHLTISDTGWAKSLWGKLYGQWLNNAAIFVYNFDRFDANDILPLFAEHQITTFCAPPTMYRFFIKEDLSRFDLSSITHATIAGEALNPEVYNQFKKHTGLSLMEGFGQTETTCVIGNFIGMTPKPGSMGKPNPAYVVDLVDPDGKPVKPGETGEIVIHTAHGKPCGLFCGYYNNDTPDHIDHTLTDAAWHDGLYHTGDMAWQDEDGYFWYVGRGDDLIKSSGYRIGPFEIESVIMELPYVLECAVTAAPDEIRGQVVKATIVLTKGTVGTDELKKEIQSYVKTHTAPYKYPRIVEFVTELPKTTSGKIQRAVLRQS